MGKQSDEEAGGRAWNRYDLVGLALGALAVMAWRKAGRKTSSDDAVDQQESTPKPSEDESSDPDTELEQFAPWRMVVAKLIDRVYLFFAGVLLFFGVVLMGIAAVSAFNARGDADGVDAGSALTAAIGLAIVQLASSVAHDYKWNLWVIATSFAGAAAFVALVITIPLIDAGTSTLPYDPNGWSVWLTSIALVLTVSVLIADALGRAENVWRWDYGPDWRTGARPCWWKRWRRRRTQRPNKTPASRAS